ncbi:MAG TPA: 6-pyruvoyl-tetrahydropterin synthase-related protein, partial [Candidatus Saccharimonadales bacterium]|nr:6-pyruvoyl-tetrahydropterin synthase-related protein [Candidatus Saccharimonadales bacterium]
GSRLAWGIVGAAILLVIGPLLLNQDLPVGSDVFATAHYVQGFMKAFGEGDWFPRWTDATNRFLGAPTFVMFPPLPWCGASAAAWLTGSLVGGFKLYYVLVVVLAGLSFYAMARDWTGEPLPAAAGAALYLLLPYHEIDLYYRFALSETTAFVFFPLMLLFARRCLRGGERKDFLGLTLAWAGLLCTHLVTSFLFALLFGPWLLWESRGRLRPLLRVAPALLLGTGLAAPVLLPAALEKSYANIQWVREMPAGDYRGNFIFLDDPLPRLGFKDPIKPLVLRAAHSQLFLGLLGCAMALGLLPAGERRKRGDVEMLLVAGLVVYFLQVRLSAPLWRLVPELPTVQFPWRFLTLSVLVAALAAALALQAALHAPAGRKRSAFPWREAGMTAMAILVAVNLFFAWRDAHTKPFRFNDEIAARPGVVDWVEPAFTPVQFKPYQDFRFANGARVEMKRVEFVKGSGQATVDDWKSSRRTFTLDSAEGGTVLVRSFFFPGWRGWLDGEPLELEASSPYGLVRFDVPPGRHVVELRFEATPVRKAGAGIAVACLGITGVLAWWRFRPASSPAEPDAGG